jgi:hypothetical protein
MEKTMDPLMRKLFQPREAREKLRGMGGIMSSSPQLASTVAKFQQGGPIQAMAPERVDLGGAMPLASAIHGPSGMMYGEMSTQELSALANGGDRLAAEVLMMLQPPAGEQAGQGSGGFSLSNVGPNLETLTAPFIGTSRDAQRAEIEAQLADQNLSEFEREALEARLLGLSGEGFIADAGNMVRDSLGRIISAPGRIAGAGLSAIGATDAGAALLEAYDAGYYDSESPRYRNAPESVPTRGPDDGTRGGGPAAPVEPTETETPVADAEAPVAGAETTAAETAPPAPTIDVDLNDPSTYDTDFDEMMKRLGGATGKDDKSSRQKAMADLAMIGLAIAAGQSPDALTNIAQGALTGMKAIRAEGAAKDAVASETRALAAKLATDKEIARMRGSATSGVEDTRQEYLYNATFNSAFQALLAEIDPTDPNAIQEISKRAREVAANAAPGAPSARGAAAPAPADLSSAKAAEDAARTAGATTFTFNGLSYPVRPQ